MTHPRIEQLYPWLLPTLEVYHDGTSVLLRDTEREAVYHRSPSEMLAALALLDGSRPLGELLQGGPLVGSVLAELLANDWLVQLSRPLAHITAEDDVRSRQLSYFAHVQRFLPDRAFDELATPRVLIVGTGGIGCHLAVNLAGSGVKKFTLNDPDTVSSSNLNRQVYFTRRDLGDFKVNALQRALSERYTDLDIETCTIDHDVQEGAPLPECDAVVVCGERESLWNRPQLVGDRPLLMAGYFGGVAVVGPCLLPGVHPTWTELMHDRPHALGHSRGRQRVARAGAWNSSGASINCTAAGLLVEATLRMLAPSLGGPILVHERLTLDLRTLTSARRAFSSPAPRRASQAELGGTLAAGGAE